MFLIMSFHLGNILHCTSFARDLMRNYLRYLRINAFEIFQCYFILHKKIASCNFSNIYVWTSNLCTDRFANKITQYNTDFDASCIETTKEQM